MSVNLEQMQAVKNKMEHLIDVKMSNQLNEVLNEVMPVLYEILDKIGNITISSNSVQVNNITDNKKEYKRPNMDVPLYIPTIKVEKSIAKNEAYKSSSEKLNIDDIISSL